MRIPDGVLPPELANDVDIVTRKSGLTPWHARVLKALEHISEYYDSLPPVTAKKGAARDA